MGEKMTPRFYDAARQIPAAIESCAAKNCRQLGDMKPGSVVLKILYQSVEA